MAWAHFIDGTRGEAWGFTRARPGRRPIDLRRFSDRCGGRVLCPGLLQQPATPKSSTAQLL